MEIFVCHLLIVVLSVVDILGQGLTPIQRRCDVPADLVFLMDASDSIKDTEWEQEKDFVSVLINNLEVERYAIHVGVIVYSTDIGLVIDLQPFKSKPQLQDLLQNKAFQINQGTDTAKAISKLVDMSYNQGRLDAKQIGVVITDGRSTNVSATIRQARRARTEYNIDLIVLGVGNETFREELEEIAGTRSAAPGSNMPQRLYEVTSFNELVDVQAQLEDIICEVVKPSTSSTTSTTSSTTTTPSTTSPYISPFPCSKPADLVFLIDGSYSIIPQDWVKGKQFISYLINSLDIGVDSINVGIVVYSSAIGDVVTLKPFRGKYELKNATLNLIQPPVGRTNTALGLETVREMIRNEARPGVPHIAIVITDGMSSNPSMTRDQAALAKSEGIVIFVVGVGERVLRAEVEDVASSLNTLFDAPDFKFLVGMVELLRDNICSAIQETTTTSVSTTTVPPTPQPIPPECKECLVEGGVGYNSNPNDCSSFIMCLPNQGSYIPQVKQCPFGLFWSRDAVSCLDARYVNCPNDRCMSMMNDQTYSSASSGCRGYWTCSNSRSSPMCCEAGFRYLSRRGCVADPSCRESCPLDVTIDNRGACRYRIDPDTPYGFLEVVPGRGYIKRSCSPGQVYDSKNCSCTYDATSLACLPFAKLLLNGKFEDSSPSSQPINVYKMSLTNNGSAFFNGEGYLSLPATSNQKIGDKFEIHFQFMRRNLNQEGKMKWSNDMGWKFRSWYRQGSDKGKNYSIVVRSLPSTQTKLPRPSGASGKVLDVVKVLKDGTVVKNVSYTVKTVIKGPVTDTFQLGSIASITTPTMRNGIVYSPIGNNRILIQEPLVSSGQQKWTLVATNANSKTGRVLTSGNGTVPSSIQEKYGFDLRLPLVEKWFILEPAGVVLQEGTGPIPMDIRNRYAGFMAGTLVKLFLRGNMLEKWQISKPDGSQLQQGTGSLPASFQLASSLSRYLQPEKMSTMWSILDTDGRVLKSGQGQIPKATLRNLTTSAFTILQYTGGDSKDAVWKITRPSGIKVLEGQGSLPAGLLSTIKGSLFSTQSYTISKWTVTLPNGTVATGTGEIPKNILDLFPRSARSSLFERLNIPTTNSRRIRMRRASGLPFYPIMDIVSNCGKTSAVPPSIHVFTSLQDVTLHLKTTSNPKGVMLTLPVHEGMNDVSFLYDGSSLRGIVNGAVRITSLKGSILQSGGPITLGRCEFRAQNRFNGEIKSIQMSDCLQ